MLGLPLVFTAPAILGALLVLPALYLLLKVTPPAPRDIPFPPLRLILGEKPSVETPARTPPWLLLLRLLVAGLVVLAMAGPIWNPPPGTGRGGGPLLVILDDGFASAPDWETRVAVAAERLTAAKRNGRPAAVLALTDGARAIALTGAAGALDRLRALKPMPFLPDRSGAAGAVSTFAGAHPDAEILWLSDGLENGGARAFAEALAGAAARRVTVLAPASIPLALAGATNAADQLNVRVLRADARASSGGPVRAYDLKGLPLGDAAFAFGAGTETTASLALPVELRNDIARLAVVGEASAGAVALLDGRSKRRRVAVVSGATADVAQPLLSPSYFLTRALAPYADIREIRAGAADPIAAALDERPSVLVLADVGAVTGPVHERIARFVDGGGLLLRFAGSRLAGAPTDDLEPVTLRRGGRTFGGALSWDTPKSLAPFDRGSPFFGVPSRDDVSVTRQVLAEPDVGLPGKTWAQLSDGTPLVTADKRGKGFVVLFHVTADTTWSNLPLSGLFVDMLRRVVALGGEADATEGTVDATAPALPPARTLDGFGTLGAPPATAKPIPAGFIGGGSADHPPGFYGPPDGLVAVNALAPDAKLAAADWTGLRLDVETLAADHPVDLRAVLIVAALAGFLADGLATLLLGGGFSWPGRRRRAAAIAATLAVAALLVPFAPAPQARAEAPPSQADVAAALKTRLAYVVTGDAAVNEVSRQGLASLSRALADRTSLDPGEPVAVDPARDELAFYPLLYWPVVATDAQPAPAAAARVAAFMKNGGTMVFDTRDALVDRAGGQATPEGSWLREFLAGVDVPELEPVPHDHVITKTFYLIEGFVGRYANGETWVEALPPAPPDQENRPARSGDSVSPIVITGNDLAAGWAADPDGEPLYPLVPGGGRQREMSIRGGVNLVMYTLTGNYKADQVHVRDLLQRLAH